jgi:hypothetical protein
MAEAPISSIDTQRISYMIDIHTSGGECEMRDLLWLIALLAVLFQSQVREMLSILIHWMYGKIGLPKKDEPDAH